MKKIFQVLVLVCMLALSSLNADARVRKLKSSSVFEGDTVKVFAKNFTSDNNPLNVSLTTGNGEVFISSLVTQRRKNSFTFLAPSVSRTRTFNLSVYGGNVSAAAPESFPIAIFNVADTNNPDPSSPEDDFEAANLIVDAVVLEERELTANEQGKLLWDGNEIADANGALMATDLMINNVTLGTTEQGSLTWNNFPIITNGGSLEAKKLVSTEDSHTGEISLSGNGSLELQLPSDLNQGASLTLPSRGHVMSVLRAEYDFTLDNGGALGSFDLRNGVLPANSRVTRAWYEVIETFTSPTDASVISLSIPTDDVDGLVAPIAISNGANAWDQGSHLAIQSGLLTDMSELTTAERNIQMTVGTEPMYTGKAVFFIEYMQLP